MKRTLERILYLALTLLLSVMGCDEVQIEDVLTDLQGAPGGKCLKHRGIQTTTPHIPISFPFLQSCH